MLAEDVLAGILRRPHRDALRNAIVALGGDSLVPAAYYADASGRKVRLVGSTVAVLDDWRTTTDTGRAAFNGVATVNVDCGAPTTFDGASKAWWAARFTQQVVPGAGFQTIISQWLAGGTGGATFLMYVAQPASGGLQMWIGGANNNLGTNSVQWNAGDVVDVLFNYDGTQGVASARGTISYKVNGGAWVTPALTMTGTIPSTIPIGAGAAHMRVGAWGSPQQDGFNGFIDRVRAGVGQNVTTAQYDAGTLPTPAFDYDFNGNYQNAGSAGHTFDGIAASGVVLCSDDLNYGPPILFTSRPAWVQNAQGVYVMRFDGVANVGNTAPLSIFDISGAYSLAIIAAMNNAGASVRNPAAIADSSSGNRILGFNTATATNNNIRGVQGNPTATFVDSTIAESATMRCAIVSKDATTSVAIDVPNHARVSAVAGGSVGAGNNALAIGNYWNGSPAANWQSEDVVSLLAISKQVSAADVAALSALAQSAAQAVAA